MDILANGNKGGQPQSGILSSSLVALTSRSCIYGGLPTPKYGQLGPRLSWWSRYMMSCILSGCLEVLSAKL